MRFLIIGAIRETGEDVTIIIDALTETQASSKASAMNILVSKVKPHDRADELFDTLAPQYHQTTARLNRNLSASIAGTAPDYYWLRAIGRCYCLLGAIVVVLAIILAVISSFEIVGGAARGEHISLVAAVGAVGFFSICMTFIAGAFLLAIGQALLAFRDIARNSWKVNQIVHLLSGP